MFADCDAPSRRNSIAHGLSIRLRSSSRKIVPGAVTISPSSERITSPRWSPAAAAGDPSSGTSTTMAPDFCFPAWMNWSRRFAPIDARRIRFSFVSQISR